jgi:hypothetical protein
VPAAQTSKEHKVQLSLKRGNDMLNIRADTATEFSSLVDELGQVPSLGGFFPKVSPVASAKEEAAAGSEVDPADVGEASAPPSSETSSSKSALEIARERMKGVKS